MNSYKEPSVKIDVRIDGSIKGVAKNALGKKIATVLAKNNGSISKIVKQINCLGETVEVTHSAWGNDFYHQDTKFTKLPREVKIDETYREKKFQEKQSLRSILEEVLKDKNNDEQKFQL